MMAHARLAMKKIVLAVGALLVLLGATLWLGLPWYNNLQEKRLLSRTATLISQKELAQAVATARHILESNPQSLPAVIAIAEASEIQGSQDALIWRQRAVELEPSLSNRVAVVTAGLRLEDPPFSQA